MAKKLIGKANHVYSPDEIGTVDISIIERDKNNGGSFVSIQDSLTSERSIIISSIEQWNQVDALVRIAFNLYS